ncbi:brachyurin-like [Ischnura elegans]|uniref:brachyurin-like n=1 Tax=Ischnura elegans TaxID=197161 RepID=UPI001ED8BED6|nr:brachyurin-like [Ischnura elegans]
MKVFLVALFALVVCASVQARLYHKIPQRSVLMRIPEQPVTGEQYDARLETLKKWQTSSSSRIVGGNTATLGQFPYQAAVSIDAGYFCGGSIISADYILTAGHCGVLGNSFTISLGVVNINREASTRLVVRSTEPHVHEKYDPNSLYADLCLLKLQNSINYNDNIAPISLPPFSSNPPSYENTQVIASGWGKTSDNAGGVSPTLQYTPLTTISNDECAQFYGDLISESQICAKGDNSQSTCNGDSGGPLAAQDSGSPLLIGVISFVSGAGCESGYPSGYTRVTTFRQWLTDNSGV